MFDSNNSNGVTSDKSKPFLVLEKRPAHLPLTTPLQQTLININDDDCSPFRERENSPTNSDSPCYKRSNSESSFNLALKASPVGTPPTPQFAIGRHVFFQMGTNGSPALARQILTPILTVLPSVGPIGGATTLRAGGQPIIFGAPSQALQSPPQLLSSVNQTVVPRCHVVTTDHALPSPVDSLRGSPNTSSPPRTLASLLLSEMTPEYMELKNFAEEFKTKRIRLGYTQGSVGQSLAQKGYNNFAQSTISRFEQMQLSPANAAAIKQVLEKWLQDAESPDLPSSPSVSSSVSMVPLMNCRKRKKRAVFTAQTRCNLDELFKQNPRPNRQIIENIADELNLLPEEVRVWFCNKRQKLKQSLFSYERESSVSSYVDSPPSLYEGNKGRSPSPKTPFTIDELSKSSVSTTTSRPLTSPMQLSTLGLVRPLPSSSLYPVMFHPPSPPRLIHHSAAVPVAQTTA